MRVRVTMARHLISTAHKTFHVSYCNRTHSWKETKNGWTLKKGHDDAHKALAAPLARSGIDEVQPRGGFGETIHASGDGILR